MKRELTIFLSAVMFYTRIPCPRWIGHDTELINLSTRYFPLIGWIVGACYATVVLATTYFFSPALSIILGLTASVLLTGAFHEDGFADVCDGFGGGWTKEKILTIMKDSRVGTYGVVGLILLFGMKVAASSELLVLAKNNFTWLAISAHSLSRMMAVIVIYFQTYARDGEDAKAKPVAQGVTKSSLLIASMFGLAPFIFIILKVSALISLVFLPMLLVTFYLMRYYKRWIGGYTGDCLGATQQVNEIVFFMGVLAVWKYI